MPTTENALPALSPKNIDKPSLAYSAMAAIWSLITDVIGGTEAMRSKGRSYLPQHAAESDINYDTRLMCSTFTPFYKIATTNMTGRAFCDEPIVVGVEDDEQFSEWLENIDLAGNHFCVFFQEVFQAAMDYGLTYIMADFTKGKETATVADEKKSGARPYLVRINASDVLGILYDEDGITIKQARIREYATVSENFVETKVQRIRVLEPGYFWLFEERIGSDNAKSWVLLESGPMTIGVVPLVPLYTDKASMLQSRPPLLELAYQNIKYYQFESNHDNALTVAQFPMLAATGIAEEELSIVIGPKKLLRSMNPSAKFFYVEHSGAAIEAGRKRLEDIQSAMALQGIKLLVPTVTTAGAKTATEAGIDENSSTSTLEVIVKRAVDAMENALQLMAEWVKRDLEIEIQMRGSYRITSSNAHEITTLLNMALGGKLSLKTLWAELQRRGVLADSFDPDAEKEHIEMEDAPTSPGVPEDQPPKDPANNGDPSSQVDPQQPTDGTPGQKKKTPPQEDQQQDE